MKVRRLWTVLCALTLIVGLAACGHKQAHPTVADQNNDGGYIDAGPVTYQMQISRELNPYSTEDSQYVKGLPPGTTGPTADQLWYGVFLWAKNQTHHDQTTVDNFEIVDTQGVTYYPVKLDPDVNSFVWTAQTLAPNQVEPGPDTVASNGPTQGGLLLFKLSTSAYSNRPLTLYVLGPDDKRLGSISLNL
ncbi:MAG: hypothetical protein ACR2NR_19040 [Solirubrobacteraceae bacterium]